MIVNLVTNMAASGFVSTALSVVDERVQEGTVGTELTVAGHLSERRVEVGDVMEEP